MTADAPWVGLEGLLLERSIVCSSKIGHRLGRGPCKIDSVVTGMPPSGAISSEAYNLLTISV